MKMLLSSEYMFWLAWIIIPLCVEILPSIGNFIFLLIKYIRKPKRKQFTFHPDITIIIPVYNSAETLRKCIKSINDST